MIELPHLTFRMKLRHKVAAIVSLLLIVAIAAISVKDSTFAVLEPKGWIAQQQYDLLVFTVLLSLVIIVPVFSLLGFIVWRYREGNKKATYKPEWGGNIGLELVWWGIPLVLIVILAVVTWQSSHALDPYKPLNSTKQPLRVQVIALQWKWLFVYPDQGIASVNYLRIPEDRPINFEITADAPMNSFWIPQLGGQVYAMNGMSTKLHLIADRPGTYDGMSANISGEGFADMKFVTEATSQKDFDNWVKYNKKNTRPLTLQAYGTLAQPSIQKKPSIYTTTDFDVYSGVIDKYMKPTPITPTTPMHEGASN